MFRIDLIRHGHTKGNEEHRYVGITDEGLSPAGRQELYKIRECAGAKALPQIVFRSPLRRCGESADILFPGMPQIVIPQTRETDFGAFEYHTYEELKEDAAYRDWIAGSGQTGCPGGESAAQVKARIRIGWEILCQEMERKHHKDCAIPACILLAHGGTIMELLSLYGEPKKGYYDWQVSCGHGYRCLWDERKKRLLVQDAWPPVCKEKEEKQII